MTSFDPLHPNTGAIIELLAEEQTLTTKELIERLQKQKNLSLSTANFYKTLGKMIDSQMLVKTGDRVSLNMVWATYIGKVASMMQEHTQDDAEPFPPFKEGERRVYSAESIEKIDPIWTHLILHFFTQESDKAVYVYESHPWFILGRPETERRMYDSCITQGKKLKILYGNTSFLDTYGHALHKTTPCMTHITDNPPFPDEAYNLWLCGDYMIEVVFSDLIAQYFRSFFDSVEKVEDFDLKTFSSIFHLKVPIELVVSRDKKKATKLRTAFLRAVQ